MEHYYKKKFRQMVGETGYHKVIINVQGKVMAVAGIKPGGLPHINDVLWDVNPVIAYNDAKNEAHFAGRGMVRFFEALWERL